MKAIDATEAGGASGRWQLTGASKHRDHRRVRRAGRGRADRRRHGADHRRQDRRGRRPRPQAAARRGRHRRGRPVGAARARRRAHPPRRARGGRGLGGPRHERAHRPDPGPRPGARRDQPGRRGVPRRDRRRRADRGDHPRLRQPHRRPDGGDALLGPHGRRHGAPLPRRDEVRARREPQAGTRRAPGQPVEPPRHRRRDPHRARRRAQLPGKRTRQEQSSERERPTQLPRPETRGAWPRAAPGDPLAPALPPRGRHRDGAAARGRVRL